MTKNLNLADAVDDVKTLRLEEESSEGKRLEFVDSLADDKTLDFES
jgi:hypothetical protein